MDATYLVIAAESFKKRGQQALANGNTETARQNFAMAANKYREAAAQDPMRRAELEANAVQCDVLASNASRAVPQGGNGGSAGKVGNGKASATPAAKQATPPAEPKGEATFDEDKFNEAMAKLNSLIGLARVKQEVTEWVNLVKVLNMRKARGLAAPDKSCHLVFKGNPGTGKTTVARLMADICHALGFLSKGHLVETDASGLVAGYVGQTAIKTKEVLDEAMGGVLFIDEAYAVVGEGNKQFGKEAIDIITKGMEDNRSDLIVIVAGYDRPMEEFLAANEGLASRFSNEIHFDDYNGEELFQIFERFCRQSQYVIEPAAQSLLRNYLDYLYHHHDEKFGNAREMRKLFEAVITLQAQRLTKLPNPTDSELQTLKVEDLPAYVRG